MKKNKIILIAACLVVLGIAVVCFVTCSNSSTAVPDNFAIEAVRECEYDTSESHYYVIHNKYDSESYLDYVTVVSETKGKYGYYVSKCEAIFQYDRTSDLWCLMDDEKWTEPVYTFTDSLVGRYELKDEYDDNISGYIEILSVTDKEIKINYSVSGDVDIKYVFLNDLHVEDSGTITLTNGDITSFWASEKLPKIQIPIKLPDGWTDEYGRDYVNMVVEFTIKDGYESSWISGSVVSK